MKIIRKDGKMFIKMLERRGTCMCRGITLYDRDKIGTECQDCHTTIVDAHVSQYVLREIHQSRK